MDLQNFESDFNFDGKFESGRSRFRKGGCVIRSERASIPFTKRVFEFNSVFNYLFSA